MMSFLRFFIRRARWVALISTVIALIGAYFSVHLYRNLRPDIEELLPTSTRSVVDLNYVTRRLEAIDYLGVLVFSQDKTAGRRFTDELAAKIQELPKSTVAAVEYQVKKEMEFFKSRGALFIDVADLKKIRTYIKEDIRYEKEMYNPLNIFPVEDRISKPKLDIDELTKKYEHQSTGFGNYPDGYYALPDESVHALLVYLPGKLAGVEKAHALRDSINRVVADLHPERFAPDIKVKYTGSVEDLLEEHAALIADLELSTIVVLVMVTLALVLFYRSVAGTIVLTVSLLMGTFWTFGLSYFLVGYLNANSAFLGSIVIGNGINFGIIFLARYLEERRKGKNNLKSIIVSAKATAKPTLVAALAAGLSYGSLMLTGFRGFRQFGIIGFTGMVLCWIATFSLFPAMLTLFGQRFKLHSRLGLRQPFLMKGVARLIHDYPRAVCYVSLGLTLLSLCCIGVRHNEQILEVDLSKLGNKQSQISGSGFLSQYLDKIFQRNLSPVVILANSSAEATVVTKRIEELKKAQGEHSLIAGVISLGSFIPPNQQEKIELLKEIHKELTPALVRELPAKRQRWVEMLLKKEALSPIEESQLPEMVVRKFRERNGSIGNVVYVSPPLDHSTWQGDKSIQFVSELREIADSVREGMPVVGTLPITSDMTLAIKRDGPIATGVALLSVCVLVFILFRRVWDTVLVLAALGLGMTWLIGFVFGVDLKINFLNFIALPITFGIGVDYGVNIFQRYRLDGKENILPIILRTGGAVAMASLTTIIGYGSLLLASNQAFVSFGRLAILGEITCLSAAIFSLPAFLFFRDRRSSEFSATDRESIVTPSKNCLETD